MEFMGRPRSYPDEFRERAVRLVHDWQRERGLSDGGVTAVARQLGLHRAASSELSSAEKHSFPTASLPSQLGLPYARQASV